MEGSIFLISLCILFIEKKQILDSIKRLRTYASTQRNIIIFSYGALNFNIIYAIVGFQYLPILVIFNMGISQIYEYD